MYKLASYMYFFFEFFNLNTNEGKEKIKTTDHAYK